MLAITPAIAGETLFPGGAFGSPEGCEYRMHFPVGNGHPLGVQHINEPPYFMLLPKELVGIEFGCSYESISQDGDWTLVTATCEGGDDRWTEHLSVKLEPSAAIVIFDDQVDEDGQMEPSYLVRCFDSPSRG